MTDARTYITSTADYRDATGFINRALADVKKDGDTIYLPAGIYTISGPLIFPSDRPVHLKGDGPEVTILKSTGVGYDVLSFKDTGSYYYRNMPLQISGLTVATVADNPGAAIGIDFYDLGFGSSVNEETVIIRDVVIRPDESIDPHAFGVGIRLSSAWNALIDNVVIHGDDATVKMNAGIQLLKNSLDVNISNFRIMNAGMGIDIRDRVEGTLISKGWIMSNSGVTDGIVVQTRPGTPEEPSKPWLSVTNTHINVSRFGIFVVDHPQISLQGNLIYLQNSAFSRGIWLEGGGSSIIMGNQIVNLGNLSGVGGGIVLNSPNNIVQGNIVQGIPGMALWLAPAALGNNISGNIIGGMGNIIVVNRAANTLGMNS